VDRSQRRELTEQMGRSTGSYELVFSPLLLALIGFVVDGWLGTRPIFTIMAAVFGLAGAVVLIYYRYANEMDQHDEGAPWARPGGGSPSGENGPSGRRSGENGPSGRRSGEVGDD
jgi:F0F1-type ATP synthase assembly protein I